MELVSDNVLSDWKAIFWKILAPKKVIFGLGIVAYACSLNYLRDEDQGHGSRLA
jgi:hypothetical protein